MLPIIWLILAAVALAGELTSLALYLGSFGVAALVTAGVALVAPLPVQLAVLAVLFVICLFGVRPAVLRFIPPTGTGTDDPRIGPVGRYGFVTERVDARGGQVRVGRGEFWTARTLAPDIVIEPNEPVVIEHMAGLVALVAPAPVEEVTAPAELSVATDPHPFGLSTREIEVLRLVAAGMSNQEIADRLFLSPRTVHHHVSHILAKMNVDGRLDAARVAMQAGIVRNDG